MTDYRMAVETQRQYIALLEADVAELSAIVRAQREKLEKLKKEKADEDHS